MCMVVPLNKGIHTCTYTLVYAENVWPEHQRKHKQPQPLDVLQDTVPSFDNESLLLCCVSLPPGGAGADRRFSGKRSCC